MGRLLFEHYASGSAVAEPVNAQQAVPEGLHHHEADFYRYLLSQPRGRLEQEYLPRDVVEMALTEWVGHISL